MELEYNNVQDSDLVKRGCSKDNIIEADETVFDVDKPMIIFFNPVTQSYVEFFIPEVHSGIDINSAIDLVMQKLLRIGTLNEAPLPKELLGVLTDEEIDLLLLAHLKEFYEQSLRKMLFIGYERRYYEDRYGFIYEIVAEGIEEAILLPTGAMNETMLIVSADTLDTPHQLLKVICDTRFG